MRCELHARIVPVARPGSINHEGDSSVTRGDDTGPSEARTGLMRIDPRLAVGG